MRLNADGSQHPEGARERLGLLRGSAEDVAALLVNWNSSNDLLEAIRQINSLYPQVPVVVVDNGSAQVEVEILSSHPGFELILSSSNLGYGAGMNLGIARAVAMGKQFVWLMNPDARPTVGSLDSLLQDSGGAVALTPRQSTTDLPSETYVSALVQGKNGRTSPFICRGCEKGSHLVSVITGTGILLRIEPVVAVGGFDPDYFHYKEEFDLVYRVSMAGDVRLVCRSLVVHRRGGSLDHRSPQAIYYSTRNELLFYRKNLLGWQRALFMTKWTLHAVFNSTKEPKSTPDRWARHQAAFVGLWHGWIGRGGRFDLRF